MLVGFKTGGHFRFCAVLNHRRVCDGIQTLLKLLSHERPDECPANLHLLTVLTRQLRLQRAAFFI